MRYRNNGGEFRRPNGTTVARGAIFAPGTMEEEAMIRRGQVGIRFTAVDAAPVPAADPADPEDNPEDADLPTGEVQSDEEGAEDACAPEEPEEPEEPAGVDADPAVAADPAEEVASTALARKRNRRARTRR